MTRSYLGGYGVDRYGVGGTTTARAPTGVRDERKTERWWLGVLRSSRADRGAPPSERREHGGELPVPGGSRTPSPTSSLSDTSPAKLSPLKSSSQVRRSQRQGAAAAAHGRRAAIGSASIAEHLDYMPRQPHITVDMRRILMDWLVEVMEEYKLSTETFWLSVALVDRSLACCYGGDDAAAGSCSSDSLGSPPSSPGAESVGSDSSDPLNKGSKKSSSDGEKMIVHKDQIQLVGCACTLIASKLHEITPPTADDFAFISDKTYTRKEILAMEARICNVLKFNMNFVTPYEFVERYLTASFVTSGASSSNGNAAIVLAADMTNNATYTLMKKLVVYLLDLAVLEYKLVTKRSSEVTAAAVYLARATLGIRDQNTYPLPGDGSGAGPSSSAPLFEIFNSATDSTTGSNASSLRSRNRLASSTHYWSKTLEYYTGYDSWDLEESVRLLHHLQENAEEDIHQSIFNKHKGQKCKRVALKTVVNVDELGFF